jgi:hypothetical protein
MDFCKIQKPGLFEVNNQLYMAVEEQYLISGFINFLKDFDISSMSKDFSGCKDLIFKFLKKSDIELFFIDKSSKKPDDLLDYVKDVSGRALLSMVFDKMEEEGDSLGLHAFRIVMIP